jgi:hypothetical protein
MTAKHASERGPDAEISSEARRTLAGMMLGYYDTQLVYVAAKLALPDAMAGGPATGAEIARAVGADPDATTRFLRALASAGIVAEAPEGRFALTSLGDLLRTGALGSLRELALLNGELNYGAFGALLDAVVTGEASFDRVFGAPFFDHLARDGAMGAIFDRFMASLSTRLGRALVGAYDVSGMGTVLDVGGGCGTLLAALLAAHPRLRGVLLDRPVVAARARRYLEDRGVAERCEVVAGDFFAGVPAGADLYVLSQTLHDWDDERCARILSNCREAMGPGGKLVVIEQIEQRPRAPWKHAVSESDLYMLVLTGGRERPLEAYRTLFRAAGLELGRVAALDAGFGLMEGLPQRSPSR